MAGQNFNPSTDIFVSTAVVVTTTCVTASNQFQAAPLQSTYEDQLLTLGPISASGNTLNPTGVISKDSIIYRANSSASLDGMTAVTYPRSGYYVTYTDIAKASASANLVYDISTGIATGSIYHSSSAVSASAQAIEKKYQYGLFANLLLGDVNATFTDNDGNNMDEAIFIQVQRLYMKDKLREGVCQLIYQNGGTFSAQKAAEDGTTAEYLTLTDAISTRRIGVGGVMMDLQDVGGVSRGLAFHDHGIFVLNGNVSGSANGWLKQNSLAFSSSGVLSSSAHGILGLGVGSPTSTTWAEIQACGSLDANATFAHYALDKLCVQGQANLKSTNYYCRMNAGAFVYSNNATFVDQSGSIRTAVTSSSGIQDVYAMATGVVLMDAKGRVLAKAKVATVDDIITKGFGDEAIIKVRLDY